RGNRMCLDGWVNAFGWRNLDFWMWLCVQYPARWLEPTHIGEEFRLTLNVRRDVRFRHAAFQPGDRRTWASIINRDRRLVNNNDLKRLPIIIRYGWFVENGRCRGRTQGWFGFGCRLLHHGWMARLVVCACFDIGRVAHQRFRVEAALAGICLDLFVKRF